MPMEMHVRSWLMAVCLAFFASGTAVAQVTGMALPTPAVGATSPLGSVTGAPISPVGIGLGATELPSSGVSPAPTVTGSISAPATGSPCSILGVSPSAMYGSTSTYDGGGIAIGSSTVATAAGNTATSGDLTSSTSVMSGLMQGSTMSTSSGTLDTAGMSGMCGSGSTNVTASSAPTATSPITPGGNPRTGVPLGSTEISNLGVSSAALLATPAVPVATAGVTLTAPMGPTMTAPATASTVPSQ
ncbi:hypothetical protein ACE10Z_15215 [Bradyrhizobium sp. Pha-3]|uniref:hypothetical protein n=1 Tax=Bradyrhizobium sp. Pha-3 TaxID=208375 RepID=UPI0035D4FE71